MVFQSLVSMISQSLRFPYRVPILMTTQSLWCPFVVPVQVSICFPNAHDVTIRELFIQRSDPRDLPIC